LRIELDHSHALRQDPQVGSQGVAHVKRIEVRGGFLDDLDLELSPGLNVLIGPRGSGKTSLLEILRFAFDVPAITPEADEQARAHALAVLSDGTATVTLEADGEEVVFSRDTADPEREVGTPSGTSPLIVSQNEIEDIGLNPQSRLQILDGLGGAGEGADSESALLGSIADSTTTIAGYVEELDQLRSRLLELGEVPELLKAAEKEAEKQSAASAQLDEGQKELRGLTERVQSLQQTEQRAVEAVRLAAEYELALEQSRSAGTAASGLALEDSTVTKHLATSLELVDRASAEVAAAKERIEALRTGTAEELLKVRRALRDQGKTLETLRVGAGDLARRLTRLREAQAERLRVQERIEALERQLERSQEARSSELDRLDDLRERRFSQRQAAAESVSDLFNREIEVRLTKGGLYREYEVALAAALEGSNLQYKALARQLVERLSPRELVEAVERNDPEFIQRVGQITADRATRLVGHLRTHGTAGILTVPLEDMVDFALLDGQTYKTTSQLSTGQRCTVVLPLLLAQRAQLTILDQPEDHLDNAFIVDTLVRAVLKRKEDSQLLIATHNANVPVLGDAERVILMSSDGRHGGVEESGPLDNAPIVEAVTDVMEGGEEAFRRRAEFYGQHG
jgi:energy-coupling factor transporter ATP-binding protein EcfA2